MDPASTRERSEELGWRCRRQGQGAPKKQVNAKIAAGAIADAQIGGSNERVGADEQRPGIQRARGRQAVDAILDPAHFRRGAEIDARAKGSRQTSSLGCNTSRGRTRTRGPRTG